MHKESDLRVLKEHAMEFELQFAEKFQAVSVNKSTRESFIMMCAVVSSLILQQTTQFWNFYSLLHKQEQ